MVVCVFMCSLICVSLSHLSRGETISVVHAWSHGGSAERVEFAFGDLASVGIIRLLFWHASVREVDTHRQGISSMGPCRCDEESVRRLCHVHPEQVADLECDDDSEQGVPLRALRRFPVRPGSRSSDVAHLRVCFLFARHSGRRNTCLHVAFLLAFLSGPPCVRCGIAGALKVELVTASRPSLHLVRAVGQTR